MEDYMSVIVKNNRSKREGFCIAIHIARGGMNIGINEMLIEYNKPPRLCPKCNKEGIPIADNGNLICTPCDFQFNSNEDFKCIHCGREVPGRFMYCNVECEARHSDYGDKPEPL